MPPGTQKPLPGYYLGYNLPGSLLCEGHEENNIYYSVHNSACEEGYAAGSFQGTVLMGHPRAGLLVRSS